MYRDDAACQVLISDIFKSGLSHQPSKRFLIREFKDRSGEVVVHTRPIPGYDSAEIRQEPKRIEAIQPSENGRGRSGEFETNDSSAGF